MATCLSGKPPKSLQIIFTFNIVNLIILFGMEHRIADGCIFYKQQTRGRQQLTAGQLKQLAEDELRPC